VLVSTEWDVELTARIEATKTVVTGAVKIIEKGRCFGRAGSTVGSKLVESRPVLVIGRVSRLSNSRPSFTFKPRFSHE
jgi:hypothetical protein